MNRDETDGERPFDGPESVADGLWSVADRRGVAGTLLDFDGNDLAESFADRLHGIAALVDFRIRSQLAPERVVLTVDGLESRFDVDNAWEYDRFTEYGRDPDGPVLADFVDHLRPTDVVWDVGANVGIYSCVAAAVVDGGAAAVHAFEPIPQNVDRIETNLRLNERAGTVHPVALGETTGTVSLSLNSPDAPGAFGSMAREKSAGRVDVRQTTGARAVADRDVPPPTVLKVDVQGAEGGVLRGMASLLDPDECRVVYCNVYEKHFDSPADGEAIHELLARAGYDIERVASWTGGYFLRATAGE